MKRFFSVILAIILIISSIGVLVGCSKNVNKAFDIVFITDGNSVEDGAENESAYNGVKEFGDENNLTYRYYQPVLNEDNTVDSEVINNYINLAVENGAQYIVMQGDDMGVALNEYAQNYSDTKFLLVDAYPHEEGSSVRNSISNVMTISFDTMQAGFLAGYVSVIKGFDKLGYFGSVNDETSPDYAQGFVSGAGYAADELKKPVYLNFTEYDSDELNYDYSFTVSPVYKKIEESKEKTYKVTVVGGIGTGVYSDGENVTIKANPNEQGKVFDHWEKKSNTDGVKDSKVNINFDDKDTVNLLVGDCDCTLIAVWKDADTVSVSINGSDEVINALPDTQIDVTAPIADGGKIFDHWETADESIISDKMSNNIKVEVGDSPIELTPVYVDSKTPTFDVTVLNGTGSGSYFTGDKVELVADPPQDGYMFYKWENIDNQNLSTGIAMENEYCYITNFEMVDRYASIVEAMYDDGTQIVFGGGNSMNDSIFNATSKISHQVYGFGYGIDRKGMQNCFATVVTDYSVAVKNALESYKGTSNYVGDCSNECLYVTNIDRENEFNVDKKGNETKNEAYSKEYADIYNSLADKTITPDLDSNPSKCLTINHWVK